MFNSGSSGNSNSSDRSGSASGVSSHLLQMQRMVAANRHRNAFLNNSNNYGDMDFAQQFQRQQRQSQQQQSWNRENGGGGAGSGFIPPQMMGPMAAAAAAAAAAASGQGGYGGGSHASNFMNMASGTRGGSYTFKCPECSLSKNSVDDLEIHIKTEHLNWLPFQCPFCSQNRASDAQMREHIHSYHKKNENKYLYIDNLVAKRMLQEMIDRSLFSASTTAAAMGSPIRNSNGRFPGIPQFGNGTNDAFSNGFPSNSNYFGMGGNGNNNMLPPKKIPRFGGLSSNTSGNKNNNNNDSNGNGLPPRRNSFEGGSDDQHRRSNNSADNDDDNSENGAAGVTVVAKNVCRSSIGDEILAQLQQQISGKNFNRGGDDESSNENDSSMANDGTDMFSSSVVMDEEQLDDETSAQLSQIFGTSHGIKSEFDVELNHLAEGSSNSNYDSRNTNNNVDASGDADDLDGTRNDVLQNLSALFSVSGSGFGYNDGGGINNGSRNLLNLSDSRNNAMFGNGIDNGSMNNGVLLNHNNNPIRRRAPRGFGSNQSVSKKRVLGECSACHKPVTAGARQMHMFFHLGKDHNTYRFRCKHPNCGVEHYRKDQMENHHSKVHGKIEAEMMEDRSLELYELCQKMSLELLGTMGNTPGPTAAKAQIMYDNMQREAELAALRKRKRNRGGGYPSQANYFQQSSFQNNNNGGSNNLTNGVNNPLNSFDRVDFSAVFNNASNRGNNSNSNGGGNGNNNSANFFQNQQTSGEKNLATSSSSTGAAAASTNSPGNRLNEETLECQMCQKKIMNRIRGFHILWHLNTDLGIIRYSCRYCDFKHDRPQSVATHGKKEHNDENCIEDSINNFEDEVKSMSKACFGREQLFAKEERRRSRLERTERAAAEQELLNMFGSRQNPSTSATPLTGVSDDYEDEPAPNLDENGLLIDSPNLSPEIDLSTKSESQQVSPAEESTCSTENPPRNVVKISLSKISSNNNAVVAPAETKSAASIKTSVGSINSISSNNSSSSKRKSTRRFGVRRPKSRKQREEMAKLREVSMRLGGAQYFKKKSTESVACEKCGKFNASRLSHHAYSHLESCHLFLCPQCNLGHCMRDIVVKHLKDFHGSNEQPTDNRLKYAKEIKEAIRECYPSCFVDAPIPTAADIERLKANLKLSDKALATLDIENEHEENEEDNDDENTRMGENPDEEEDGEDDDEDTKSGANRDEDDKITNSDGEGSDDDDEPPKLTMGILKTSSNTTIGFENEEDEENESHNTSKGNDDGEPEF